MTAAPGPLAGIRVVELGSIGPTRGRSLQRLREDPEFAQAVAA